MSGHKKEKTPASSQQTLAASITINPNATMNGDTILKILGDADAYVPISLSELMTQLKRSPATRENPFPKNDISALEILGTPDIEARAPYGLGDKRLFGLKHTGDAYSLYFGDTKASLQPTKVASHYLVGSSNSLYSTTPGYGIWYVCKESRDMDRKDTNLFSEKVLGAQAYLYVQRPMKNGKVGNIEKIDLVNLGENHSLEITIGDNVFISEGLKKPWHNIREYTTTFNADGKM